MNQRPIRIAPSILSADFRYIDREIKAAQDGGADYIHCDIMDGCFVPNITMGPFIVGAVKKSASIPLDVHLMIVKPERFVKSFADAGADIITVHAEACEDIANILNTIHGYGVKAGIAVNPDKEVDLFEPYLSSIDMVLIMSVYAGFGGQKFIPEILGKIDRVYNEGVRINALPDIEVDGGINAETALLCARSGANVFVAGNYIFNNSDYAARINSIRSSAQNGTIV